VEGGGVAAKFELTVNASETAHGIALSIDYNTDLFEAVTIARLAHHFGTLLESIAADPAIPVHALPLLDEAETHHLLETLNATQAAYPRESCIHELFEAQARRTPDRTALLFKDEQLTYGELDARANRLAAYLRAKGVGPETVVGLCMERSADMVAGLMAILKAGGAYVPLDPAYPADRLAFMAAHSGVRLLLTQASLRDRVGAIQAAVPLELVLLDDSSLRAAIQTYDEADAPKARGLSSSSLAYVIYTSGSTGQPKGIMIEHRNTVAFLHWASQTFTQAQLANVLVATSVCFDLFVFEIFAPLVVGGQATVVKDILDLHTEAYARDVSLINTVPSVAKALMHGGEFSVSGLTINLAGEPLDQKFVDELYRAGAASVYDLYGPTEATTYSTFVLRKLEGSASIGRPISNTYVYVLNAGLHLAPHGTPGELYIGGAGLARGYLNRPDLTEERFVRDPFSADPHARMYKTGDLVRYLDDGKLEYMGRIDFQVKIRGFRIELGEIENCLLKHPDVASCAVLAREDVPGEKRLVAYLAAKAGSDAAMIGSLRAHLMALLPEYMVPGQYVVFDALPLTPNGKIDRKALQAPDSSVTVLDYIAPVTGSEVQLAAIWAELLHLNVDQVSAGANFFALGGHSLLAIRVVAQLRQRLGVEIGIRQIFHAETLSALAAAIDATPVLTAGS
jgi:amino acid adenylation domain-containing protein